MGLLNMKLVNTTPGANVDDPFCPPKGFDGSAEEYMALCRKRLVDVMHGQRMYSVSKHATSTPFEIKGPYAEQAKFIIGTLQ